MRGEPNLIAGAGGHTRKIIPRQSVFALEKPPARPGLTHSAGFAGKPKLTFSVERDTKHLAGGPKASRSIANRQCLPVCRGCVFEQAAAGSDVQRPLGRDGNLVDPQSVRPVERKRIATRDDRVAGVRSGKERAGTSSQHLVN